ncbi:phosphotransferase [Agreia sp. VKM Ac-1783]|uniref:phosphotransferase enzyme family protein n=1 Tax=Agreia sp. VKM Ac-1783 TaxID=1938889 RepID=UPI000A36528C|nr:phosphotransferase [Agreia sp. VKM Ac-1783]
MHGICARWQLAEMNVDAVLIAVSENATFRVSVNGLPRMVVRLHRPGYVGDLANARSELTWVEAISTSTPLRTPPPVRGVDGDFVQSFPGPDSRNWSAVAFEFVSGRILEEHTNLVPHFAQIGRLTAVLHQQARSWKLPPGFQRFDWNLTDMVGPTARWGNWENWPLKRAEHALVKRAEEQALSDLSGLTKSVRSWGLIHSDLRPSNLMLEGNELTVIDFDDAGFSWFLYDFASALTFYEHTPEAPEMAANWIEGYSSLVPLTIQDRKHAAALSVIRRLTMLGWATTHREDALPKNLWTENAPGTVEIASRYLANSSWLVDG